MRSLVREVEFGKAVADNRSRVLDTEPHAAGLRSPSHSVRNPATWFQLGIIGDALKARLRLGFSYGGSVSETCVFAVGSASAGNQSARGGLACPRFRRYGVGTRARRGGRRISELFAEFDDLFTNLLRELWSVVVR